MRQDIARIKQQAQRTETATKNDQLRRYAKKVARKAKSRETRLQRYIEDPERVEKPSRSWQMKLDFQEPRHVGQDILRTEELAIGYDEGRPLLADLNLVIQGGSRVVLSGANGSGKTTLFDCLSRVQDVSQGKIFFKGEDITGKKPYQVAHMGLARTFQVIRVYRQMTVLENMLLSRQWRGEGLLSQLRPSYPETEARARDLIHFLTIEHLIDEKAGNLSGGQQRLLEIGMALMPDPDLILLDEAASGVNPTLVETIKDRIRQMNREQGKTFLLIEHNMHFIADLCHRVFVLNYGEKLAEGTPAEVMEDDAVIEAYFGAGELEGTDDDGA
jgi:ABC-type branched-subunit amino acid transport system ATPase component